MKTPRGRPGVLEPATVQTVWSFWARRNQLEKAPTAGVVVRAVPEGDHLSVTRVEGVTFVVVPDDVASRVSGWEPHDFFDVARLRELGGDSSHVLGPAALAYADRSSLDPVLSSTVVPLPLGDARLARLAATVPDAEWGESGVGLDLASRFAVADSDGLVAVAGYQDWNGVIAHLCVITRPNRRKRGHGLSVASAAANAALQAGRIPQWRSALRNVSSSALGERLGFVRIGEQVTVLLG
jgi:hypothetical protein